MSKSRSTQVFGTKFMGEVTIRPDGTVIKHSMLDPREAGYVDEMGDAARIKDAYRGSRRLLAALQRARQTA